MRSLLFLLDLPSWKLILDSVKVVVGRRAATSELLLQDGLSFLLLQDGSSRLLIQS